MYVFGVVVVLAIMAPLSFVSLASSSATVWAYVGVGFLWCVAGAALWKASAPARRGDEARLSDAAASSNEELIEVAQNQIRGSIVGFLWALVCVAAAAAAFTIALIATGYPG